MVTINGDLKNEIVEIDVTSMPLQGIFIEHDWDHDIYEGKKILVSSC